MFSSKTHSCSCSNKPSIKKAKKQSSAIFSGVVVKKDTFRYSFQDEYDLLDPSESEYSNSTQKWTIYRYKFGECKIIKGGKSDTVLVFVIMGEGMCEYSFDIGKKYTVYCNKKKVIKNGAIIKVFFTDVCTRTRSYADEEIRQLIKCE
jgi:hypothetical protein